MRNKKLIAGMAVMAILLAGCGQGANTETASNGTVVATPSASPAGTPGANGNGDAANRPGGGFSDAERQMMLTFQALISMDKQSGLALTKDQATKLLPQVEKSVQAGSLADAEKSSLESLLTADQKTYYSDMSNRGAQRGGTGQRPAATGDPGQARQGQGRQGGQGGQGQGGQVQGQPGQGQRGQGSGSGANGGLAGTPAPSGSPSPNGQTQTGGGFQRPDVGAQLVELLKSKINS